MEILTAAAELKIRRLFQDLLAARSGSSARDTSTELVSDR
jgi:hypothetical protein